ncbi:MAG: immunoglobulin domain-containing protein [Akkermansiaceae bacterium]|nr:immunoglobulin domain-containing protein [Akkermansiaceae bacterium]
MNPTSGLRKLGVILVGFGLIGGGIVAWQARSGGKLARHAGPVFVGVAPPLVTNAPVVCGAAVAAEIGSPGQPGKQGGRDSLGAALAAARRSVEELDPAAPHARGARYFAANPEQQLRAWFSNDGVELASGIATPEGEEPWGLKVRLQAVGRAAAMTPITPSGITGNDGRVEMHDSNVSVTQWFENRQEGLEQGFTLRQAPAVGTGGVVFSLGMEGNLRPLAMGGPDGIRLVDSAGADVLHYSGLKAWDADGRVLPARMELRGAATLALMVEDAWARYPVTVDPLFANVEARLVERSVAQDFFGSAVALAGDTAVVGAPFEDTLGHTDAGGAYVFLRTGTAWRLQAKLAADDLAAGDFFGTAVAISGDTVVVGADWAGVAGKADAGKAYVFVRSGTVWNQQLKLTAADAAEDDHFGAAVAISGDTAVVGAPADDITGGDDAGSAYVFVRSGVVWSQQAQLKAYDGAQGDLFGTSVAVDGGTAVVGAPSDHTAAGADAGSAYVFVRSGITWNHEDHLLAPDGAAGDGFGCAVAVAGDTVVVGAKGDDTAVGADAGNAHVFVRSGVEWSHQAALVPGAAAAGDGFGSVISLDGDVAVVGAPEHATNGQVAAGNASVFSRSGNEWSERAMLAANGPAEGDSFGAAVAVSGGSILVGVLGADTEAGLDAGSARVFTDSGVGWNPQAGLVADNSRVEDLFGVAVALSGDTALIGAFADDTPAGVDAGSAYVFVRRDGLWAQEAKLSASEGSTGDAFGAAVALAGDAALVGASADDTSGGVNAGSVTVFSRRGAGWVEDQVLVADDGATGDRFGCGLALAGDTAVIGAVGDDTVAGANPGSAYVFRFAGGTWLQEAHLGADDAAIGAGFGGAVALDGETAVVGASGANTTAGLDAGQVYVFTRDGVTWPQQARLAAPDAAADDWFGAAVAVSGDTILVGAPYDFGPGGLQAGSAHVFLRSGVNWAPQAKLTPSDPEQGECFGLAVGLDGEIALVGAPCDDLTAGIDAGSAYVYARTGSVWGQQLKLTAGVDASADDAFGAATALSGTTVLVGAYGDTTAGPGAGSAYVYLLGELPVITLQPKSKVVTPGQIVTFTVAASGYGPLFYQWRRNGFPLEGADGPSHVISSAQLADQGNYDCVVSNIGGVVTSAEAMLAVNALSEFNREFPGPPFDAQGFVLVTIFPSDIGAGWRFVGEQQWRPSGVPVGGLATGDREIEFQPVSGYIQPPREVVSVFSGEAAALLERIYYETPVAGTGGLTVVIQPASLAAGTVPVEDRAQWRLLGDDDTHWRDTEATLGGLLPGNYLVECKPVAGRTTPPAAGVVVTAGQTILLTVTYRLADPPVGIGPTLVPFETVTTDETKPYGYVGQIRSDTGSSSGFLVKPRVVATAGHVVFDDGTLAAVTGLQWLHQRHRGSYESAPKSPRGFYIFDDYAAQRAAENTPGSSSPLSQHLDAAAIYFLEDVGRGGASGYLASDLDDNEFLLSAAEKILAGYPVDGVAASNQGRMHATPSVAEAFTRAFGRTFTSTVMRGMGGMSGGPLCVRHDNGTYYPAAIYLGGSGQTVVRAIDSGVIDLFSRAEVSGNGGDNNTGGGITHASFASIGAASDPSALKVTIQPAEARDTGAGWKLDPEAYFRVSGAQKNGLNAGTYTLQLKALAGFEEPEPQVIVISGGELREITFTYADVNDPPTISAVADQVLDEDGVSGEIPFTVFDPDDSQAALMLSAISSNQSLVPDANLLIAGTAANRTLVITPEPNQSGTATITLTVSDGSLAVTTSFSITVHPVNDAPTIGTIADQSVMVNHSTPALSFVIGDIETAAAALSLSVSSSDAALLPPESMILGGDSENRTLVITPATNHLGSATVTVTVSDGSLASTETFLLTVTATALEQWRLANFNTVDGTGPAADSADPDGDGKPNLDEFTAGTDPNNSADFFRVLSANRTPGGFTVTAAGKAGRSYVLERSTAPGVAPWTVVGAADPLAADGTAELSDPAPPAGAGFYRVKVTLP